MLKRGAMEGEDATFRAFLESAPDAMVLVGEKGRMAMVNAQVSALFGYAREDLVDKPVEMLVPERFRGGHAGHRAGYFADPRVRPMGAGLDLFGLRRDGSEFPVEISLSPIDVDGAPHVLCAIRDISARKRAEEETRRAQRFLDSIVANIPAMVFVKDAKELRFVRFNKSGEELLGIPQEELIGKNDYDLFPKEEADFFTAKDREVLSGKKLLDIPEEPIETRHGLRFLHTRKMPILDGAGEPAYLLGISVDITERKRAQEAIRENEARLAEAQRIAHLGSWEWELSSGRVSWSRELYRIYGVTPEEFSPSYESFLSRVHPDDRARVDAAVGRAAKEGRPLLIEHRVTRPDGSVASVQARGRPVLDEDGRTAKMIGTVQDVTERADAERLEKEKIRLEAELAERKRSEETLERQARELARSNSDLEQFAYVASHDLQEPLRMVASYTQLLARRYRGQIDRDADEYIDYAVDGVARMQRLIQDLLEYSRVGTSPLGSRVADAATAFDTAVANLKTSIDGADAVVTRTALPEVAADFTLLVQLFQNLIGNALKFRKPDERPSVTVAATAREGEWVFSVGDNGIGLEPQFAERIFVIFKRLHGKNAYPGTGIGLAICKKIVERHSGRIWVESEPGKGSVFYFSLPRNPSARKDHSAA